MWTYSGNPLPFAPVTPPVLHGDGVTDDTDAVQWYLDRRVPLPPTTRGYLVRSDWVRSGVLGFDVHGAGTAKGRWLVLGET